VQPPDQEIFNDRPGNILTMNVRSTSIDAYKKVVDSGLLSKKLIQAFTIVYRYGPKTSRELNAFYVSAYKAENNLNQFRALLTHLQNVDVIQTTEKVVCPISQMTVYQFDITGRLPVKEPKVTMKDKKANLLKTVDALTPWVGDLGRQYVNDIIHQINNL
jgi:hypothetical protein